jgi:hypothetical protein
MVIVPEAGTAPREERRGGGRNILMQDDGVSGWNSEGNAGLSWK